MRNPILAIAIAFVLAAPCTALAEDKHEKWIELNSTNHQVTSPTSTTQAGSPKTKAPTTTPTGTAGVLGAGGTGPTKPTLPTTGRHQ